jgi:hypothetical protein
MKYPGKRLKLEITFKDSPTPAYYHEVTNICTEGGLLRIIMNETYSQWFPLVNVFRIKEIKEEC